MEPALATLFILGLVLAVSALIVDSQPQNQVPMAESQPARVTPPPPPPPPPLTPPPPSPPPPSPPPSSPPPPPPPPLSPPPPSPSNHFSPPPPRSGKRNRNRSPPAQRPRSNGFGKRLPRPPPPKSNKLNTGKKIGLLFAAIAGILQIGVVGFLVYKRRQILKVRNRYETCT